VRSSAHEESAAIERLFAAKARAELATADRMLGAKVGVAGSGDPLGRVLLVKGTPGAADLAAGSAIAGPDGEAADKALAALGRDPASAWRACSRPVPSEADTIARRLETIVEAVDPGLVIALDAEAAADLAAALRTTPLRAGEPVVVRGRRVGAVSGLEGSLGDAAAKARVWRELRAVAGPGQPGS
jgi:uracil-DNA glycosylase